MPSQLLLFCTEFDCAVHEACRAFEISQAEDRYSGYKERKCASLDDWQTAAKCTLEESNYSRDKEDS